MLETFVKKILVPGTVGQTLTDIFLATENENLRAADLEPILRKNPAIREILEGYGPVSNKVKEWESESEGQPDSEHLALTRLLGLLGKQSTRNLVACIVLKRIEGKGLPRAKGEFLLADTRSQLKYALFVQDYLSERRMAFSGMGFLAGFHYDLALSVFKSQGITGEPVKALDIAFKDGFRMARLVYYLMSNIKKVPFENLLFGAAILLPLGKVFQLATQPDWRTEVDFLEKLERYRWPRWLICEPKKAEMTHAELVSMWATQVGIYKPIELALAYYQRPLELRTISKELGTAALALGLCAKIMARAPEGIKNYALTLPWEKKGFPEFKIPLDDFCKKALEFKLQQDGPK